MRQGTPTPIIFALALLGGCELPNQAGIVAAGVDPFGPIGECYLGALGCECTAGGGCDPGLVCSDAGRCEPEDGPEDEPDAPEPEDAPRLDLGAWPDAAGEGEPAEDGESESTSGEPPSAEDTGESTSGEPSEDTGEDTGEPSETSETSETGEPAPACEVGSAGCPCTMGGGCDPGLVCSAGECMAPEDALAPFALGEVGGRAFYRIPTVGPMGEAEMIAACASVGLQTPCGSIAPAEPDSYDYGWYGPECVQVIQPNAQALTLHSWLAAGLACGLPLGCEQLLGAYAFTAGNNAHWSAPDTSLGGKGIESWAGWNPPEPTWVNGLGGGWPNVNVYSDRDTICVAP